MSREFEDPAPRPPRPKKPRSTPPPLPDSESNGAGTAPSTFRPNPAGSGGPAKPRAAKSGGERGRSEKKTEIPAAGPAWYERILFGRVSSGQLAQFCRQFGTYLHSGVDFSRSLSSLEKQFARTALGPVIGRLQVAIRSGSTLEDAVAAEPQTFSPMFISMIKVAEARGGVPETLRMMGRHYEARQRLIRQARSAMIYPIIVLTIALAVIFLITVFVLPTILGVIQDFNRKQQLPGMTQALIIFSRFMQTLGWWIVPAALIGGGFLLLRFYRTPPGKDLMDRLALMTPVLGTLCRKVDTTRFARTLSVLLDAGLDYGRSIDLTADVLMMSPIRKAVRSSREQVLAGRELSATLARSRQFYPDVIAIISSGEETGKLPESLNHLADDYEEQVETMVKNLGQLVQPLLMLFLGGFVGFIIIAVFMAYIQMITSAAAG
jgi:type II secretory pathway component PulF